MSQFHMPTPSVAEVRRGIAYVIGSVFVFSVVNALIKWLVADYPVTQVVFFRCVFALLPCAAIVIASGGWTCLRTSRVRDHALRAGAQFFSMGCIFVAFGMMP